MSNAKDFLIASDLDGTFFGAKSAVLPRNLKAIQDFQAQGGAFTLATGRSYAVLRLLFPEAKEFVSGPAIVSGGACLYDFKKELILDKREIPKDLARRIIRETRDLFPNAGYRICTDLGFLTDRMTDHLAYNLRHFTDILTVDDLDRHLDRMWFKLTYCVPAEEKPALAAHIEKYKPYVTVSGSGPETTEILHATASKGQQIENLRKLYPGRKIICVGDYDNDLDMLTAADVAACPANANEEVKSIASLHLCDHKDGCIADLINQLLSQN